jgi:hypothetical protein
MLPRNWSVPCEVGEMRYKFSINCRECFQLGDLSDLGFSLQAITLRVKKNAVLSVSFYRVKHFILLHLGVLALSSYEWFRVEDLAGNK